MRLDRFYLIADQSNIYEGCKIRIRRDRIATARLRKTRCAIGAVDTRQMRIWM